MKPGPVAQASVPDAAYLDASAGGRYGLVTLLEVQPHLIPSVLLEPVSHGVDPANSTRLRLIGIAIGC